MKIFLVRRPFSGVGHRYRNPLIFNAAIFRDVGQIFRGNPPFCGVCRVFSTAPKRTRAMPGFFVVESDLRPSGPSTERLSCSFRRCPVLMAMANTDDENSARVLNHVDNEMRLEGMDAHGR
jgi:hypothetical protein